MSNAPIQRALLMVAIALCAVALCCCVRDKDAGGKVRDDLPLNRLHDGDLLFRCGVSFESGAVARLDSDGRYTHVGIAVNDNGSWRVVHAVPGESNDGVNRVKVEPVDSFYLTTRAVHGAAMRLRGVTAAVTGNAAREALRLARRGILFDDRYDWNDHSRLYCTELVQEAYSAAGVDLAGGRSTLVVLPFYKGRVVFPSDISENDSLLMVFSF